MLYWVNVNICRLEMKKLNIDGFDEEEEEDCE